jgi:ribosomal protein S12
VRNSIFTIEPKMPNHAVHAYAKMRRICHNSR